LHHAEDDAKAIYHVLCDPRTSTFDPDDVRLFVGPDTTADQVKAALMKIMSESSRSDVLVVYFAGHSLTPTWSRATDTYLVTPELDQAALARDPDAGLRMTFLKRDVLEAFPGNALLILDCCRAGALLTAPGRDVDMISVGGRERVRYTALMASAAEDVAREDPALGHGVLTYHALQAMRSEAADANGHVTFQSLGSYVTSQDITPEPGFFTQTWGRGTVLTRPGPPKTGRYVAPPTAEYIKTTPLENPLDRFVPAIRHLIDRVSRGARDSRPQVEYLKSAMDADSVAVLEHTASGFKVIDSTPGFDGEYVQDLLRAGNSLGRLWFGHHASDERRSLLSVPLQRNVGKVVLLAVLNPSTELLGMGEPLAKILQTVWRTDIAASPDEAEIHVLTDLRKAFGRLPRPIPPAPQEGAGISHHRLPTDHHDREDRRTRRRAQLRSTRPPLADRSERAGRIAADGTRLGRPPGRRARRDHRGEGAVRLRPRAPRLFLGPPEAGVGECGRPLPAQ